MPLKALVGIESREVPVSMAALHVPSSQKETISSSIRMRRMGTIQWPCSGSKRELQERSSRMCLLAHPPNAISLSSPVLSARKTPKVCGLRPAKPRLTRSSDMTFMKLNSGACDSPARPRPKMPSKLNLMKGSSDMSVAATSLSVVQAGLEAATSRCWLRVAFDGPPLGIMSLRQRTSSMKTPSMSPVPKATEMDSRGPAIHSLPPASMSRAVSDLERR
mmetsp:Transcript_34836/g.94357  ORF Transcript_34836/g.94357 Transcript_34836/m.94357 type:complete len:219 (+) Transcript_34836:551-1207(+)